MDTVDLLPDSILSLSGRAADKLLALGDPDAALVYLHILRRNAPPALNWDGPRLQAALDKLAGQKLIAPTHAAPAAPEPDPEVPVPEYSLSDVTAALSGTSPFSALADEVERRLGKKLSTPDLKTLLTIYDHLALPPEVIILIVSWCSQEIRRKYGPGRKPFLSQIRREAFRWAREGIDTAEAAEEHLHRLLRLRTREGEIARLLDLPDRPLVEREQKYIAAWLEMGFDNEALRLAYEKTVMGTTSKSMDWRYMNGILRRWHEKGLHTARQVRDGENAPRRPQPTAAPEDSAARARLERERTRRLLEKMNKEQGG